MMTTSELTEKYKVSRQTINNWVRNSEIPAPKEKRGTKMHGHLNKSKLLTIRLVKKINLGVT